MQSFMQDEPDPPREPDPYDVQTWAVVAVMVTVIFALFCAVVFSGLEHAA